MPVNPTSRYHLLPYVDARGSDGQLRRSIAARRGPAIVESSRRHVVVAGETIESIARRELGSSEAWWLIADANPRIFPLEIRPGMVLTIPSSRPAIERNRVF